MTQFTGRHLAAIMIGFFAVVIAVNVMMARIAVSTFGGAVVDNSYVASQHFNRWLDQAARDRASGLRAQVHRRSDGRVEIELSGTTGQGLRLGAVARHPLGRLADRELAFVALGSGRFVSRQALPAGRWIMRLTAHHGTAAWRAEKEVL